MLELTPTEARVLGVLIEKAATTPEQYPLSINAATNGSNQKNNRDPVMTLAEDEVFEALESLRGKGLAVRVDSPGSRVHKYRHHAGETLRMRPGELAVVAELLLRGPQTVGELRQRAGRMAPLDSIEAVKNMLAALMTRDEPMVRQLPGSRADRYAQTLCPDAPEPEEASAEAAAPSPAPPPPAADPQILDRLSKLESEVASLRSAVHRMAAALGETMNEER